jgi:hypothetical protein
LRPGIVGLRTLGVGRTDLGGGLQFEVHPSGCFPNKMILDLCDITRGGAHIPLAIGSAHGCDIFPFYPVPRRVLMRDAQI